MISVIQAYNLLIVHTSQWITEICSYSRLGKKAEKVWEYWWPYKILLPHPTINSSPMVYLFIHFPSLIIPFYKYYHYHFVHIAKLVYNLISTKTSSTQWFLHSCIYRNYYLFLILSHYTPFLFTWDQTVSSPFKSFFYSISHGSSQWS